MICISERDIHVDVRGSKPQHWGGGLTFSLVPTEGEALSDEEWGGRWDLFSHIGWCPPPFNLF